MAVSCAGPFANAVAWGRTMPESDSTYPVPFDRPASNLETDVI